MIEHLSKVLITVACADGEVVPEEHASLVQIYEKLGIPKEQVDTDIEACFNGELDLHSKSHKSGDGEEDGYAEQTPPAHSIIISKDLNHALASICADKSDSNLTQVFKKPVVSTASSKMDFEPSMIAFLREISEHSTISRIEFFTIGIKYKLMGDRIIQKVNAWATAHDMPPFFEDGNLSVEIDNLRLKKVL